MSKILFKLIFIINEVGNFFRNHNKHWIDFFDKYQVVNFKNNKTAKSAKSKKKGGSLHNPLVELIAPLGVSAFISTGILTILNEIFKKKMIH
jgi:hypothetical protein